MSIDQELREMMAGPNATTRVFRRLGQWRKGPVVVGESMREALELMRRFKPAAPWQRLGRVAWNADRAAAAHWLQHTLMDQPFPESVRGLWISAPEFGQRCEVGICGCPTFSTSDESSWNTELVWPAEDKPIPVFRSRVLEDVEQLAEKARARNFLDYTIPPVYTTLLMLDLLPLISPRLTLRKSRQRGVGCGFNSGDWQAIGMLTAKGWAER